MLLFCVSTIFIFQDFNFLALVKCQSEKIKILKNIEHSKARSPQMKQDLATQSSNLPVPVLGEQGPPCRFFSGPLQTDIGDA